MPSKAPTAVPSILNPDNEVPADILAKAIVSLSESATKLLNGPLRRRAILVLLKDMCGSHVGIKEIELVLESAGKLKERYVK